MADDVLINKAAIMQKMVGFRKIAVYDYRKLSLEILRSILETRLGDFRDFARTVIGVA